MRSNDGAGVTQHGADEQRISGEGMAFVLFPDGWSTWNLRELRGITPREFFWTLTWCEATAAYVIPGKVGAA